MNQKEEALNLQMDFIDRGNENLKRNDEALKKSKRCLYFLENSKIEGYEEERKFLVEIQESNIKDLESAITEVKHRIECAKELNGSIDNKNVLDTIIKFKGMMGVK